VLQGLGAATARVVPLAIIRDLYSGREMARIVSFVMMVFTLAPAVAPLVGSGVIALTGWRGIFGSFIVFATITSLWLSLRLVEPLAPEARRPFRAAALRDALHAVLAPKVVRIAIAVQTLCLTTLFSSISSIQQLFEVTFQRSDEFPLWFFMMAICAGTGSFLNASLVMRLGMRRMIAVTLALQIGFTALVLTLFLTGLPEGLRFPVYLVWQTTIFFQAALTLGNINALAMEPLGHVAGMAASVVGALATVGSVILTIPVGLAFDGTPLPLLSGVLVAVVLARFLMMRLERAEKYA
jgi:DHA1 family bicyclomycin/chloramphenicol resistance-like MFS transporter